MAHQALSDFIRVLRQAEVPVTIHEAMLAYETLDMLGFGDRTLLKDSLSMVLAKTGDETETFNHTFDRFFSFDRFSDRQRGRKSDDEDGEGDDGEADGQQKDGAGGEGEGQGSGGGEGGGGGGTAIEDDEEADGEGGIGEFGRLASMILNDDGEGIAVAMAQAARAVELNDIVLFTQKGLYVMRLLDQMGLAQLDLDIENLEADLKTETWETAIRLKEGRADIIEDVRDYVEQQLLQMTAGDADRMREDVLRRIKLTNVSPDEFGHMYEMVRQVAKKLIALHARRKKIKNKGHIDMRRTIQRNMSYGGVMFDIHWKTTKIERPKIYAVCDVSGSVAKVSQFLLMFLYSMNEVLPKVRSFVFSNRLYEVTRQFDQMDALEAIDDVRAKYGQGVTDYGTSFQDLKDLALTKIDKKSTVIILGDARNNYNEPKQEILKELYDRSKRLIWLNPEPKYNWTTGDSEMRRYQPYCHQVEVCNTLVHLERVINQILKYG